MGKDALFSSGTKSYPRAHSQASGAQITFGPHLGIFAQCTNRTTEHGSPSHKYALRAPHEQTLQEQGKT